MEGNKERGWPSPRSWERVAMELELGTKNGLDDDLMHVIVEGLVGEGAALEFMAFLQWSEKIPDIGKMLSGEIKGLMADYVTDIVKQHQEKRAAVTPEVLRHYFNRQRTFDNSRSEKEPIQLETDEVYDTYGINFDKSFGAKPSLDAIKYESHNGW